MHKLTLNISNGFQIFFNKTMVTYQRKMYQVIGSNTEVLYYKLSWFQNFFWSKETNILKGFYIFDISLLEGQSEIDRTMELSLWKVKLSAGIKYHSFLIHVHLENI